jgi:RimJ/RimL family protein N-acetyltransferase
MNWPEPVFLRGPAVTLEPLSRTHHDGLVTSVRDGELWKLWYTSVPGPDEMLAEIERRLQLQEQGSMLPFAVIGSESGEAVGMTTYLNIDAGNRRLEIGATWYRQGVQRTNLNTWCKLLLLTHAFDTLGCIAVEFRTHYFNSASRRAIERLGAKLDGVLRNHALARDGSMRDTCVYSIIAGEWPAVRSNLNWQLNKSRD